jgi:hypothetical protein
MGCLQSYPKPAPPPSLPNLASSAKEKIRASPHVPSAFRYTLDRMTKTESPMDPQMNFAIVTPHPTAHFFHLPLPNARIRHKKVTNKLKMNAAFAIYPIA